jgi:hypothetical protein
MNKRRAMVLAAGLLAGLLVAAGALAQGATAFERWVVASGGGECSGAGEVALNSTVGEAVIGPSGGGSVLLAAGYWHGGAAEYGIYLPLALRSH